MPATMHYANTAVSDGEKTLPLRDHIKEVIATYYKNMVAQGTKPENVYELVMAEVELPLIEATMEYTGGNQSRAAKILGINRGTFRKKLAHYGML
ncbi:helix-turn-helix domain-containing protein [Fangia hongkongensis]|uniref:helix-turn-helix domain-containing protein n=1 Tax=Fangia hongkongensis TaxID=270495 RepID=UPI00038087BF|nr:helix-turn-helix domain-containing protein [Fangia hongkongensis]MBK2124191.1 Fis family transcriptional regulator [Fangia hongkongensis]